MWKVWEEKRSEMVLVGKSQGMRQLRKPRRRLREILNWVLKTG